MPSDRFIVLFIFFTFLFLFYPGNDPFTRLAASERNIFVSEEKEPAIQISSIPVVQAPPPVISAQGAYVVEYGSFTPVLAINENTQFFPASTAKIITALVARELYKTNDIVTVNETTSEGQLMDLYPGERITVENLLYGLLIHSGNDAAFALARATSYDQFILQMNETAQKYQMKNSYFTNPAGFDDTRQVTTPFDLALAARVLLRDEYLRKIVATKEIVISDEDYRAFHRLTNVNKLLGQIQGIGGLKTGYTELAGENLVSFYRHNGHDYIVVIMKSEDRFEDTTQIVNWINSSITYVTPEI